MSPPAFLDTANVREVTDITSSSSVISRDLTTRAQDWIRATRESEFDWHEFTLTQAGPQAPKYPALGPIRCWLNQVRVKEPSRAVISGTELVALFELDLFDALQSIIPLNVQALDSTRNILDIRLPDFPRAVEFFPIAFDFDAESRGSERRVPVRDFDLGEFTEEPEIRPAPGFIFGSFPIEIPKHVSLSNSHLNALRVHENILPPITVQLEEM